MTDSDDTHEIAEQIAATVKEPLDEDSSRRGFLARTALAGGTLLALGGGAGAALAQEDDGGMAEEMTATFDDVEGTDIDVLNYALTLEHLEDAFYREATEMFSEDDFVEAEHLQSYSEEFRRDFYGYVGSVADHEAAHADVLTQAVELLGGEPAAEGTYDFGVETVGDFLSLGQVLENTGVAAYAGAAPYIESPDLLGAALSIHSVEARHAAVFNEVTGMSPFPDAFDPASSQQEVLEAVSPFIVLDGDDGDESTDEGTETETETDTATETSTDTPTETWTDTPTETPEETTNGTETPTETYTPTESE